MDEETCNNCYYIQNGKHCYNTVCKHKYGSYWRPRIDDKK